MRISELHESSPGASSSSGLSRSKASGIFFGSSEVSTLMIPFLGMVNRVVSAGISSRATVLLASPGSHVWAPTYTTTSIAITKINNFNGVGECSIWQRLEPAQKAFARSVKICRTHLGCCLKKVEASRLTWEGLENFSDLLPCMFGHLDFHHTLNNIHAVFINCTLFTCNCDIKP